MPYGGPVPLLMSKAEWKRIGKWADKDKEDPETVRKREYIKLMDTTSAEMTRSWPNSLENVNKRNEELRRARIEAAEQANTKFYKRYLKRQKEEQERLMYTARDLFFKSKDAPKLLLSAVIETVVLKERQEQLKFQEERRREDIEQKRKDDDDIIRKAKEWHELVALKKKRRFDANKAHQRDILEQAHEVAERRENEYETELNMQKMDNINADEQMAALAEFDENFKAAEKQRIWSDMERSKQEGDARKREQAARDLLDDRLIEVLQQSKARIERRRKQTEKDTKAAKLRVLEKISQRLESGDAARDAKEQAILRKAIEEKEALNESRRQAQLKKEAKFKQDRIDSRHKFLRDEAQRLHEFNTMRQWEIMNRFKNEELNDAFKESLREEKERKVKENRSELLRLWKERAEREARERADTKNFYGPLAEQKLRDYDNKLFTHAAALEAEALALGRPAYPLRKALDRYCKMHRLYPMPDLPKSMQEHFQKYQPRDGSKPDPWYREPPAPPVDRGPDAPDDEPSIQKRDGLEPIDKAGPSQANTLPQNEDTVEPFKRQGPANGLQQRNSVVEIDVQLPPI